MDKCYIKISFYGCEPATIRADCQILITRKSLLRSIYVSAVSFCGINIMLLLCRNDTVPGPYPAIIIVLKF